MRFFMIRPRKRVFTFNGRSNNATVIDAVKDTVVATIPLGRQAGVWRG